MAISTEQDLESKFLDSYEGLNPAQKEAVDSTEGPVMVIAGPGTGKTQILAMRIANILRNPDLQCSPQNILALTFTESGVTAMRNRLISIVGTDAYYVRIHTFHSSCNEVIKENPDKFLTIKPIADLERIQIFNSIIDELDPTSPVKPFGEPYLYRGDLISLVQELKRESISPDQVYNAIIELETFFNLNQDLIEDFISRNARSIKEEDCNKFLEELFVRNQESKFTALIQDFYQRADRITTFKNLVKDYFQKNLKQFPKQKELVHVYREYQKHLRSNKLYDFEDMILRVINQFENDPDLLAEYQEESLYILADEYQDTNAAQNKILELLTKSPEGYQKNPNIFVVGDDDQSIYRFQGASLENIIHFYKTFEEHVKLIVLTENYRSQQNILDLANTAIDQNEARISKLIPKINKALNSAGEAANYATKPIKLIKAQTYEDELKYIAEQIKALTDNGCKASEIAILFRENKEAEQIMNLLARLGIRSRIDAGDNILEDRQVQQLLDLLRVINKPESNSALLFNLMNYQFITQSEDFKDISIKDIFDANRLRPRKTDEEAQTFIDTLLKSHKFKDWAEKIITYTQLAANIKLDILVERIIKDFAYLDFVLKSDSYTSSINKLDALFNEIKVCVEMQQRRHPEEACPERSVRIRTSSQPTLDDLIKHLDLIHNNGLKITSRNIKAEGDYVRLMTAHRSKGLEFDHVFLLNCRDKLWGNKVARAKLKLPPNLVEETAPLLVDNKNEDDRRLFYVAMTRAKKELYLSYHCKNSNNNDLVPSLFITDLQASERVEAIELEPQLEQEQKLPLRFQEAEDFAITEAKEYIDSLLSNYKLSITHLNNYLNCPRKFFYQNLLRVPQAKNRHASFGTAVHAALFDFETSLRGVERRSNPDDELKLLLTSFEDHLKDEYLPEQEHKDVLGIGEEALTSYYKQYQANFGSKLELEYDFGNKGINLDGIELTGKLDKIEILNDSNEVKVIDYKTGNPDGKSTALKAGGDYHRQIVFYQLLCELGLREGLAKFKMLNGEIDFIQQSKTKGFVRKTIEVRHEDLEELKAQIKTMHGAILAHEFGKTDDTDSCQLCSFKNICGR